MDARKEKALRGAGGRALCWPAEGPWQDRRESVQREEVMGKRPSAHPSFTVAGFAVGQTGNRPVSGAFQDPTFPECTLSFIVIFFLLLLK